MKESLQHVTEMFIDSKWKALLICLPRLNENFVLRI